MESMSNDNIRPGLPSLAQLAHRKIRLPLSDEGIDLGAITLGDRIGNAGHYGYLYTIVGQPHTLLKLIHLARSGPPSVVRQVYGYRLIEAFAAEIPTVKIIASHCGGDREASYLIVENLYHGRGLIALSWQLRARLAKGRGARHAAFTTIWRKEALLRRTVTKTTCSFFSVATGN